MGVEELIKRAIERGITGLPMTSHLANVRVWPSGAEWVAEIGQPPHVKAITAGTGLFTTPDEARSAALTAIAEGRAALREQLPDDLAVLVDSLPDPVVSEWD